jgi:hypothetical protein
MNVIEALLRRVADLEAIKTSQVDASILTATQTNGTVTPAILTGCTFTIPPNKKAVITANLIATAAATTTGIGFGVRAEQAAGADGNLTGSAVIYVNLSSAAAATGVLDGDVFNVAASGSTDVIVVGTDSTAGNVASKLQCVLRNRSTNVNATLRVIFRSEVAGSDVIAQIGSGAVCVIEN